MPIGQAYSTNSISALPRERARKQQLTHIFTFILHFSRIMGCTETKVFETVRRVQVSASSNLTTDKSIGEKPNLTIQQPNSSSEKDDPAVPSSRVNSGAFSLNLNESLDSRLSVSFKSQTPSAGSVDSGICELDEEYSHVITEYGRPELVRQVERDFVPKNHLELCVLGRACPRRSSARPRDYVDEHLVLQTLREEGLIQRPQCAATGGLSFEVVSIESAPEAGATSGGGKKLPPIQLERMEQRSKRRKLTKETIQEKLIKAEERRKQKEEEKVNRLVVRPKTAVLREESGKFQEDIREKMIKKMEACEETRQKLLQERKERLALKREHSAKVRLRKMLNPFPAESVIAEESIPEEA